MAIKFTGKPEAAKMPEPTKVDPVPEMVSAAPAKGTKRKKDKPTQPSLLDD